MAPIVHIVEELYREIYKIGNTIPKRDKLGIHNQIENISISLLINSIKASLAHRKEKATVINKIRILTETLKYLVRIEHKLSIIDQGKYILLETKLIEVSKMATNWERYIANNST